MAAAFPAELALVAACCRWPPSPEIDDAIRARAAAPIDWPLFERVVQRHRVGGLTHDAIRRTGIPVPAPIVKRLARGAAWIGRSALTMANETRRLHRAFADAGLPAIDIKGSSLALLAYGRLGIKQSIDIDLLTIPEAVIPARRVLESLGYRMTMPAGGFDDAELVRALPFTGDVGFRNGKILVELHWRPVHNRHALQGMTAATAPTQQIMIGDGAVTTFADEELFAYLCVHGTRHAWLRLKWLADVAAFLARHSPDEIERLYDAAKRLGAGRGPDVVLALMHRVLGAPVPERFRAPPADAMTRWLIGNALASIGHRKGEGDCSLYTLPGMRMTASQFFVAPGLGYFGDEARGKWLSAGDRARIDLPRPLHFLYHPLRIPLLLGRIARRSVKRQAVRHPREDGNPAASPRTK